MIQHRETRRSYRNFAAGLLLALSATVSIANDSAAAVPGDFDADGTSDMSVALVNRSSSANAGTTAWVTRLSNGANPLFWTWNVPGDAFVSGRFFAGDARYYPGVVWVRSAALPLEWYLKTGSGTDALIKYGLPGDTIPNQADLDGDGVTDFTVIRTGSGNVLDWYVALSGSGGQLVKYVFGVSGDKPGLSDVDGDGIAEFVVLRPGTYVWYVRKPSQDTFTEVQWGLNGDIPLLPRDIDGDGLADYVIARKTGSAQVAYIRYGNGQTETRTLGFDSSVPQLGNFDANNPNYVGLGWSQRDSGWVATENVDRSLRFFQLGISTNVIIRADGTVVQPSESGTFPASSGGGSGGGGDSGGGSTGPQTCTKTIGSKWLFKPASQDSGGEREGRPLILFTANYPQSSCLDVLAINGTVISNYGKFASNRFYEGWGCGKRHSASQNASLAQQAAGSTNILLHDPSTGYCYGPAPADKRTDRR